jgi:PilZ domain
MRMPSSVTKASHSEARRADRLDVAFPAFLRESGTTKIAVKVTDLSVTGFRCETSFTIAPGTTVWLTIPGLAGIEANVAWRDRFLYGCSFKMPLHVAVFDHVARLYPPSTRAAPLRSL